MAKIFLPSLDWRTKALHGNFGKDSSCHPWTDEQKLYVGTLAKIFLPSLDWRTKALRGNFGKDFPAILGLMKRKLYVETLAKILIPSLDCRMAQIFLPSLDWRTKALCGNFGKDFPAILGLTNKSCTWELWQRFSCHPWTDEQKLYVETLAKISLPSLDCRMAQIFLPSLDWSNKSSTWELWQRFSCHPWTDEQKLYVGTLAKIFLPSLDWRTKALRGNFGKDFPAILGLTNKSSMWELWQRFSCHPWTDEQKLYVGTLAKIFLPSLDWRTKALHGNFCKDFPAILGLTNGKDFPAILGLTNGKDFPAILGLTNKSSTWKNIGKDFPAILRLIEWHRFSWHPSTDRIKALCGNIGKDFPAILGITNKSCMWELW